MDALDRKNEDCTVIMKTLTDEHVPACAKPCGCGLMILGCFHLLLFPYAIFILPPMGTKGVSLLDTWIMLSANALFVPFIIFLGLRVCTGRWIIGGIVLSLLLTIGAALRIVLLSISESEISWYYYLFDATYFIVAMTVCSSLVWLLNASERPARASRDIGEA